MVDLDASSLEVAYQQATNVQRIAAMFYLGGVRAAFPVASYYARKSGKFFYPAMLLIMILRGGLFVLLKHA